MSLNNTDIQRIHDIVDAKLRERERRDRVVYGTPPPVVHYTPGDCCAMCGRYFDACKCPAPKLVPQTPGWKCGGCNASSSVGWFRTVYGDTICTTCGWSERLQRALDQNTDLKRRIENIKSALK